MGRIVNSVVVLGRTFAKTRGNGFAEKGREISWILDMPNTLRLNDLPCTVVSVTLFEGSPGLPSQPRVPLRCTLGSIPPSASRTAVSNSEMPEEDMIPRVYATVRFADSCAQRAAS